MVSENCHSSKRHKFVYFRLKFNYFNIENKVKLKCKIILFFIELEIDLFFKIIFKTKQNIFIIK